MISLGERMKTYYEGCYKISLTRRTPVILRLDGRAFHSLTRDACDRPFDNHFHESLLSAACRVLEDAQGAKCAYIQSDEISILLCDFDRLTTQAWFGNDLQKLVSVTAGQCSSVFSDEFGYRAHFDCRAFNLPEAEVNNYFVWRQQDWLRNSVTMLASKFFSHSELEGKNKEERKSMLLDIGEDWEELPDRWKYGTFLSMSGSRFLTPWYAWERCPRFVSEGQDLMARFMEPEEE